jgi:hypothetical protein
MMPTPFILNDAVVIKQQLNRRHRWSNKLSDSTTKKASRIIKVDSLKSNNYPKFEANNTIIAMKK